MATWRKPTILGSGIIRKLSELYILTTPWDTEPKTSNAKKRFENGSVGILLPKMEKKETVKLKITQSVNQSIDRSTIN